MASKSHRFVAINFMMGIDHQSEFVIRQHTAAQGLCTVVSESTPADTCLTLSKMRWLLQALSPDAPQTLSEQR